eukprot:gene14955-17682_t
MSSTGSTMSIFKPLSNICESFNGIHCVCGDLNKQVVSYHYCSQLDADRRQCLVYDSDEPNAKLIAVEYIISENLFSTLPDEERKYWHSHMYDVENGLVAMTPKALVPNIITAQVEAPAMKVFVNTYGKTWQFWPIDESGHCSSDLSMGAPQLLMSFTEDGQVRNQLVYERDKKEGISTAKKRNERRDIKDIRL